MTLPSSTPDTDDLRPERALLTPIWLGALALLVANDHWLKGAHVLPGELTGKLSDFAGMLVAPVLLAAILSVVLRLRSRRVLAACHVAVGLVFAGIQLSPAFAGAWSSFMGLFGHPWVITRDPTDLLALPFLLLSWRLLLPAMDGERPAMLGLQRSAVAALSVFGLWATVATSDDGEFAEEAGDWDPGTTGWDTAGEWEDVSGQVYVHNPNDFEIGVTIRTLRSGVVADCQALASNPSRLLDDSIFGEAQYWSLPPTTNVGVEVDDDCAIAKVSGEGVPEQIILTQGLPGWHPGSHASIDELSQNGTAIVIDPDGGAEWVGGESFRYTPSDAPVEVPEPCLPPEGEIRVDWSELPSVNAVEVLATKAGIDGCHELQLRSWTAGIQGQEFTWYLCAPGNSVRFELGSFYSLEQVQDLFEGDTIRSILLDAETLDPVTNQDGALELMMQWGRGVGSPLSLPEDMGAEPVEQDACPWVQAERSCAVVERDLSMQVGPVDIVPEPGNPAVVVANNVVYELDLLRAREVALVDSACTTDSRTGPYHLDYALFAIPLNP